VVQKKQLIGLLKERKQIMIQQAVTKGLNPKARLKDSGIDWIREIPEGWEVKRLKYLIKRSFGGGTPSTDNLSLWNGGIPWVSSVDVKTKYLYTTKRNISKAGLERSSSNLAPKGSIIIVTRSGILQHTLPVAELKTEMAINQDIKCLIQKPSLFASFLLRFVEGYNNELLVETRQQGATVESIDMENFYNFPLPLPPLSEQKAIVAHIETKSAKIDRALGLQEKQIAKLKEYKQVLINSAVTGKVKVLEV
jgi:type I restriction enzyme S subunit